MRTVLLMCLVLLHWIYTDAGPVCFGVECVDGATCVADPYVVCACPADKPKGDAKFICYAGDRLVAIEFGDPYVATLIPGERYKIPLPCGQLVLRGNLPAGCYISVYANGADLDSAVDIRNAYISGLEFIIKKGDLETRMHIDDKISKSKNQFAVDEDIRNGIVTIHSAECDVTVKYRNEKPFVVIDIPKSENHYEGSMLPSRELHQTLKDQAHEYNLTLAQEILYTLVHTIDSRFQECNHVRDAMFECVNVADEDVSTSICGQFINTNDMTDCLSQQFSPRQLLQHMGDCISDVCHLKKPPCQVIAKHFTSCKAHLNGALDMYNCNL